MRRGLRSDGVCESGERHRGADGGRLVGGHFVESAADVLHERMSADQGSGARVGFQSTHRPEPPFESAWSDSIRLLRYRSVLC